MFQKAADDVLTMLWGLMESGQEELKLLQTAILLITTNFVVQHESLAKVHKYTWKSPSFCTFSQKLSRCFTGFTLNSKNFITDFQYYVKKVTMNVC